MPHAATDATGADPGRTHPPDDAFAAYEASRPRPDGRPWLLANMVAGVDGSLSWQGKVGTLSSEADRSLFVRLRGLADAVLVGAGTVRAEGYGPVKLSEARRAERRAAGRTAVPPLVVVSRSLDLDWDAPLWDGTADPAPLVLTAAAAPADAVARARARAEVVVVGEGSVDLRAAMAELSRRGMEVVVTEGGPTLLDELVGAGLLDELCVTITPRFGGDPLTMAHRPAPSATLTDLRLAGVVRSGDELYLRYLLAPDDESGGGGEAGGDGGEVAR